MEYRRGRFWGEYRQGGNPAPAPRGRLASADPFGQGHDDASGAAEVAEPVDVLVLRHPAEELGAVGAQAPDGVVDVVDGEHDAMHAQRVMRRALRLSAGRRGGEVLGKLQPAVAVWGSHHRDVAAHAVESDGAVRPRAFDMGLSFQLHAELGEERDSRVQVVDDDADVVHPLKGHVSEDKERGQVVNVLGILSVFILRTNTRRRAGFADPSATKRRLPASTPPSTTPPKY